MKPQNYLFTSDENNLQGLEIIYKYSQIIYNNLQEEISFI